MIYQEAHREKIMQYLKEGHTYKETSERFMIAIRTLENWRRLQKETGGLKDRSRKPHPFKKIDPEKFKAYVEAHPDAYQKEIAEEFDCSATAVQKALKRLGYTRKKTKHYKEQSREKVEEFLEVFKKYENLPISYVDETGIDTYLSREYGYAPRGQKIMGEVCGRKYRRVGIVAALLDGSVVAPSVYSGTMAHDRFESWFSESLLPALPEKSVVVMDNASFHRKNVLTEIASKSGHVLLFLPPYSPELNPIEHYWSWLKRHLRKVLPSFTSFDDALRSSLKVA